MCVTFIDGGYDRVCDIQYTCIIENAPIRRIVILGILLEFIGSSMNRN